MVEAVFRAGGTIDKFIGDAIMAIYGAPVERPNHAANACMSALEMMEELFPDGYHRGAVKLAGLQAH